MNTTSVRPNLPGVAPQQAAGWKPPEQFTYDHIPRLRELLPQLRGVPGFYYLQCAVANRRRAEAEGWQEVANTVTYTIRGPVGTVDACLYCFGERISGTDYRSSKRDCLVDDAIFEATGHRNGDSSKFPSVVAAPVEPEVDTTRPRDETKMVSKQFPKVTVPKVAEVGNAEESK